MKDTKETRISFDTAKLAKEKGFDWECLFVYKDNGAVYRPQDKINMGRGVNMKYHTTRKNSNMKNAKTSRYAAPTQSALQRWFREKHHVYFHIMPITFRGLILSYTIEIAIPSMVWCEPVKIEGTQNESYEVVLEKALQEAHKLVNNK